MTDIPRPVIVTLHTNPDSKEAVEFYRRLGMCIASWAYVDRRLYQIASITRRALNKSSPRFCTIEIGHLISDCGWLMMQ